MATTRNRATGSTKKGLRSISNARIPAIVVVEESESDDLGETSLKMSLFIKHPNARAIVDRIQTTHGSSWELADSDFAYNLIYVFSDKERNEVIRELKRDGLIVQFSEYELPRSFISSGPRGVRKSGYVWQKSQQRKLARQNLKSRRNHAGSVRKTRDEYAIEVNYGYGHGWEHEISEDTLAAARERKREYQINAPQYPVRIRKRRVKL